MYSIIEMDAGGKCNHFERWINLYCIYDDVVRNYFVGSLGTVF